MPPRARKGLLLTRETRTAPKQVREQRKETGFEGIRMFAVRPSEDSLCV